MLPTTETLQMSPPARLGGPETSALDVERVLCRHRDVQAVAVAAAPNAACGADVLACVVLRGRCPAEAQQALAEELTRFAMYHMAYYEAPGFVAFVDELPAQTFPGTPACVDTRSVKTRWIGSPSSAAQPAALDCSSIGNAK